MGQAVPWGCMRRCTCMDAPAGLCPPECTCNVSTCVHGACTCTHRPTCTSRPWLFHAAIFADSSSALREHVNTWHRQWQRQWQSLTTSWLATCCMLRGKQARTQKAWWMCGRGTPAWIRQLHGHHTSGRVRSKSLKCDGAAHLGAQPGEVLHHRLPDTLGASSHQSRLIGQSKALGSEV